MATTRPPAPFRRRHPGPARPGPGLAGLVALLLASLPLAAASATARTHWSGIHPHLAMFNADAECGTGAVVPWAGRLWVITYAPHRPRGSSDRLYEITRSLRSGIRPESVGGTPAGRMIHRESRQLFLGPYAIDGDRQVRVLPPSLMPGRLTGLARHLTDPAGRIYVATMEEGFYDVDVRTLEVTTLFPDANGDPDGHGGRLLPGYHGKGLYSGQGVLVYANNGEASAEARLRPDIPSGCLAEWDGRQWRVVRRNQFTEVTGPGGLRGNPHPDRDPIWSVGWDHRSLILMVRDAGAWHSFRLPKASHCYDGAHGWNTEWPRIRDVGTPDRPDLLMTMHGMFWRFPNSFSARRTDGLRPRSTYLKVIGDFCRWEDRIVFGCDDAARSEFLNRRRAKEGQAGPGESQSNLWFVHPRTPDHLGPRLGRGAVWLEDDVAADSVSDPYLAAGFDLRGVHVRHGAAGPRAFTFEIDRHGRNRWTPIRTLHVAPGEAAWLDLTDSPAAEWIRVRAHEATPDVMVWFTGRETDRRTARSDSRFRGLAGIADAEFQSSLLHARGEGRRTLGLASPSGYFELGPDPRSTPGSPAGLELIPRDDPGAHAWITTHLAIPTGALGLDAASVIYTDDAGRRWRLPRGHPGFDETTRASVLRIAREVVTERDLFQVHGTFYELPAENAGGVSRLRPIASHDRRISDFASYRGLLVLSGVAPPDRAPRNRRIVRSADGKAGLWLGTIDDLWALGKPRGHGGPWCRTPVRADAPSDPYLMTGFDRKHLVLSHESPVPVAIRVEIDPTGGGRWFPYRRWIVPAGESVPHEFPRAFDACWLRAVAEEETTATVQLTYE